jgi:putative transposase
MFWYVILLLVSPLYLLFGLVFRGEEAGLVLALHHQVLIPRRQVGKRPSPVPSERPALVLSSLLLGKEKLRETLLVVPPETLVGWHRAIARRHWRLLSRREPGRPPEITPEMERSVLQIARENLWMGYGKIAGEMRKLGFAGFGRSPLYHRGLLPRV